ncbi:BrnA antitoxin family protein [Inquilinus sp. NPDC058860]|uniref:BrnA antitoxin family protein n=1 Tax=Inquilinus sp. NPDC058860 TaxID=3346652 RepID=UPI0036A894B0
MRKGNSDPLTKTQKDELAALEAMPDSTIDTTDAPPVIDWTGAQRGKFYRPVKKLLSLRLDADLIAWFKEDGEGYQTRINEALREYVEKHRKEPVS